MEVLKLWWYLTTVFAAMYFQRVTERDSFQKRNGSRIRERTFHGQQFSTVGWQGVGCPVEDCCADGAMQSRGHGGSRGALTRQGERERRCQNLALRATATGGEEGRGGHLSLSRGHWISWRTVSSGPIPAKKRHTSAGKH